MEAGPPCCAAVFTSGDALELPPRARLRGLDRRERLSLAQGDDPLFAGRLCRRVIRVLLEDVAPARVARGPSLEEVSYLRHGFVFLSLKGRRLLTTQSPGGCSQADQPKSAAEPVKAACQPVLVRDAGTRLSGIQRAPLGRAGAVRHARPGPSWSCPTRAPPGRAGAVHRARHRAELELSDACATGAELNAATMAAVLARATGPNWSRPTCAPRPELGAATLP
jgi:hypothetical protein